MSGYVIQNEFLQVFFDENDFVMTALHFIVYFIYHHEKIYLKSIISI